MGSSRLRIGIIAPPWVPVPPPSYGGTELVLDVLARGLLAEGHDVTLFTTGDSTCEVPRLSLFEHCDPDRMGASVLELRHAAAAYEALAGHDVIHDHTLAGLFVSELYPAATVVTTNHGPFNEDLVDIYRAVAHRVRVIAISRHQASTAPPSVPVAAVIPHGLDLDRYPVGPGGDYLFSLGRMNHDKGIDRAIAIARAAGLPLVIAAKMREPAEQRYFAEHIEPHLGDDVTYVGEVGHAEKVALLQGARALLNPIRWPEPFGLVMIESLACGTPVLATHDGAAPEIVTHGHTGFLGRTDHDLIRAASLLPAIDRADCRARAEREFSAQRMVADHTRFFHQVLERRPVMVPSVEFEWPGAVPCATGPVPVPDREPALPRAQVRRTERPLTRPPMSTVVPSMRTSTLSGPNGTPRA